MSRDVEIFIKNEIMLIRVLFKFDEINMAFLCELKASLCGKNPPVSAEV